MRRFRTLYDGRQIAVASMDKRVAKIKYALQAHLIYRGADKRKAA
jgi:hypothetical protein